jgi:2-C-methyl-D-erythritol 4-phosphate cytidylyltransferase
MTSAATTGPTGATISLIVPAAGCGARAAQSGNKVLAPLAGRPLLFHTLLHLLSPAASPDENPVSVGELVIAARREEFAEIQNVWDLVTAALRAIPCPVPQLQIVEGGASRQDSVLAAVRASSGEYVAVHDAARPFAGQALLNKVWWAARVTGAAIAALPASDTVKRAISPGPVSNEPADEANPQVGETLDRAEIWLVQTPQVFRREILREALEAAQSEGWAGTDCASAVERLRDETGSPRFEVALVGGEALNFKVTFAPDMARAEWMLQTMFEQK